MGIPVDAAVAYRYSSETEFGGVLTTGSTFWRESIYFDPPSHKWAAKKLAILSNVRPALREHWLWVAKWPYFTARCSINTWTAKEKNITIGFKANVGGAGELDPDADSYESSADSGWIHSQTQGWDRKVVFFEGLQLRYTRFSRSGQHLKDASKGRRQNGHSEMIQVKTVAPS